MCCCRFLFIFCLPKKRTKKRHFSAASSGMHSHSVRRLRKRIQIYYTRHPIIHQTKNGGTVLCTTPPLIFCYSVNPTSQKAELPAAARGLCKFFSPVGRETDMLQFHNIGIFHNQHFKAH